MNSPVPGRKQNSYIRAFRFFRSIPPTVFILALISTILSGHLNAEEKAEFFENKIRPVLATHCFACHGLNKQESELRVDHISFLTKKGFYGIPVTPGNPEQSTILSAMKHIGDLQMPEGKPKLPESVIADFQQWITDGAFWPTEPVAKGDRSFDLKERIERLPWIWQKPEPQPLSDSSDSNWPENEIDHFILAKLKENHLKPSDFTDRATWYRRLHIALLGIVPTPRQIEEFESDSRPDSREIAIDTLLASPRFGERWARHWMDLMRYSETRGHESDFLIANAWHYRNYLIDAFNSGVPYDQFVMEHIAGDLLKQPRLNPITGANQSVVATGWAFLGEEVHAPVNLRQDECDRTDNKIDVLSKSFLGLTVACARCHDHKFDAITQQDYYALSGFILSSNFRQVRFETAEHNRNVAKAYELAKASYKHELASSLSAALEPSVNRMRDEITAAVDILKSKKPQESDAEAHPWVVEIQSARNDTTHILHPLAIAIEQATQDDIRKQLGALAKAYEQQNARADAALDGVEIIADYRHGETDSFMQDGYTFGKRPERAGELVIGSPENPVAGIIEHGAAIKDSFWDVLQLHPANEKDSGNLQAFSRAGRMLRTPKTSLDSRRIFYLVSGAAEVYAGADSYLMVAGPIHQNVRAKFDTKRAWIEQNLTKTDAHRAHVEFGALPGKRLSVEVVVQAEKKPVLIAKPSSFLINACQIDETNISAALVNYIATTTQRSVKLLSDNALPQSDHPADYAAILNWVINSPELFRISDQARDELGSHANKFHQQTSKLILQLKVQSRTAISLMDGNGVNEFVLNRGNPQQPTYEAPRMIPTAFPHATPVETDGSGRMHLARQIVDERNPLTARVIVNRVWHHMFGQGIVRSVDNFGYLGQRPSHPELLDHLAWQFMHDEQWDIKRLIRKIALSSTFRLSSQPNSKHAEMIDPENTLLHRASVRRMEAEVIRDSVLAVSGQLNLEMHGPPIPVQLTEFVVGRGAPSKSGPLDGNGRRSIYIAVRRNFLPTLMTTFDFPIPFTTRGTRNVTNVPAQSLALMNDPLIYQQANKWAESILGSNALGTTDARVQEMYKRLYGKEANHAVIENCKQVLQSLADYHDTDSNDIKVWHDFAHALFSANDFIYIY